MAGPIKRKPFAQQLGRVRKVCLALPDTFEKLSHGEPTFFVRKRVFAMFSNDHHRDGHVSVLLPSTLPACRRRSSRRCPVRLYRPPYVGGSGWIGVELDQVSDEALEGHIREAWTFIVQKEDGKRRAKRTGRATRSTTQEGGRQAMTMESTTADGGGAVC